MINFSFLASFACGMWQEEEGEDEEEEEEEEEEIE
ncbi:hypothetical protein T4A_8708 [Trichinella pseudospiralis]|uniref:Uncharacterized protein n=1 Tax=Trichinella pseudospiralis TaxID=6337 RepID=A0A0V1EBH6_TRIPS|nr:hypothetical protein T4A_8708 [Trichinella pseudospiralis]KRY86037.1 hypothetical protein T4D_14531 [Trichinella pseudospiralis]KRZ41043.1 hypothetical protein T4C_1770 [Trichinella pseudospiralis]